MSPTQRKRTISLDLSWRLFLMGTVGGFLLGWGIRGLIA